MKILNLNWLFLNGEERNYVNLYLKEGKDTLVIWYIFSLVGNLLPVVIAFSINLLINSSDNWLSYFNNGALPLISYGFLISGIIFLLDETKPRLELLKKKILGIALLLLFITISLFILLTSKSSLGLTEQKVLLGLSIIFGFLSAGVGSTMVALQKAVVKDYKDEVDDTRKEVINSKGEKNAKIEW